MNLALVTQDFPPEIGGIETYAQEIAKRFSEQSDEFLVVAPKKYQAEDIDLVLPYPVRRIPVSNSSLGLAGMLVLPPYLKKKNIRSIFHTQWQTLPISVFAKRLGVVDSIYVAAHARELLFNPFVSIPYLEEKYEIYKRWLLSQADLFFPVSQYTAKLLQAHGVSGEQIKVVGNGTDPKVFYPTNIQEARNKTNIEASKVLLTITRLVSRKGVDTALKAFKDVLENHPESKYVIVGEGKDRSELQQLAVDLNIDKSILFTGRVGYEDLIHYYNACDVFVMPSKTTPPNVEGFGIVFLEANACGKPVIGTYSGGIPSAIINGETGFMVEEEHPKKLANLINKLFENPELAQKIGQRGRHYVEQDANWDATARSLLQHMKMVQ